MNCLIVGGFLGAGKTTFINSVLKIVENEIRPMSIALLLNEFGEIPVDDILIEKRSSSLREITGGCTLKVKLKVYILMY